MVESCKGMCAHASNWFILLMTLFKAVWLVWLTFQSVLTWSFVKYLWNNCRKFKYYLSFYFYFRGLRRPRNTSRPFNLIVKDNLTIIGVLNDHKNDCKTFAKSNYFISNWFYNYSIILFLKNFILISFSSFLQSGLRGHSLTT